MVRPHSTGVLDDVARLRDGLVLLYCWQRLGWGPQGLACEAAQQNVNLEQNEFEQELPDMPQTPRPDTVERTLHSTGTLFLNTKRGRLAAVSRLVLFTEIQL